jgi:membrane fusion protein, copper/silver efflux system
MTRAVALCALVLAAVAAVFSWSGGRETAGATSVETRKVLYYMDPMHPAYRSDRPGTAPDCGMALVPVYETSATAGVRIRPDMQRVAGLRVETVRKAPTTTTLRLYGRVAPDESRIYRIDAGVDGYVREVAAVATGSRVENGQWLATLAAPDARTPVQAYLVALDAVEQGTLRPADVPGLVDSGLEQAADRLMTLGMSRAQIDEIKRTRLVPATIRITAPAAGFVLARTLTTGRIAIGEEMFRIADLRQVWIYADVPGRDAGHVRPGAIAEIAVPARGITLHARVSGAVPPQFDTTSQSVKVRLDVDNPGAALRPDMSVDVRLPVALPAAIAVPVDAVLDAGLTKRVFVERADGAFEPREVETGWRFGDRVEIVTGLAEGDRVVVAGTFLLDSESRLRHAPGGTPPSP